MADNLEQPPNSGTVDIESQIGILFNSELMQYKLKSLVRYERGGDTRQAASGTLGAAHPELLKLAESMDQQQSGPLETVTQEAISEYSRLWELAQKGELTDRYGRNPHISDEPKDNDSLVNMVLEGIEFSDDKCIKRIEPNDIYFGDVFESQVLYRKRSLGMYEDMFDKFFSPEGYGYEEEERIPELIAGRTYVVPSCPYAGYNIALFIPNDGSKNALVRVRFPDIFLFVDDSGFSETYDNFFERATQEFRGILQSFESKITPSLLSAAFLFSSHMAEQDGFARQLSLRKSFDKAVNWTDRKTGKREFPGIDLKRVGELYDIIMKVAENYAQRSPA